MHLYFPRKEQDVCSKVKLVLSGLPLEIPAAFPPQPLTLPLLSLKRQIHVAVPPTYTTTPSFPGTEDQSDTEKVWGMI